MNQKTKKKFIWLDPWNIEEQESWFSDMHLHGWEYVTSYWMVQIFRCDEDTNAVEIYTDPIEQAETISFIIAVILCLQS